jgi:hypothetical protein
LVDRGVFEMTIGGDGLKDFCIYSPTAAAEHAGGVIPFLSPMLVKHCCQANKVCFECATTGELGNPMT